MNLDSLLHKAPAREWSPLQQAIFASATTPRENRIIRAVAGSGKTTTIVEDMNRSGGDSIFLAFNKAIASDLSAKVSGATVKTLNALGHGLLSRMRPGAKLDAWRVSKRMRQVLSPEDNKNYGSQCCRAISLAKSSAIFDPSWVNFAELMDAYELDIPFDLQSTLAKRCQQVWQDTIRNEDTFDFDDQLFIPIREQKTFPVFSHVYVDEAQDLSPIQHLMVQALVDRGATVTAVGDPRQAIYGFRGATSGSMDQMQKLFNCKVLPLDITYRCPLSVVRLAQQIVPEFYAAPNAREGSVVELDLYPELESYRHGDLILCRNNAPIFALALHHLRENKSCQVLSNFMETIERFIEQFDCVTSKDFRLKLDQWYKKERDECEQNNRMGRLAGIDDRYETLRLFADRYATTGEMVAAIRRLASGTQGPRISTVHKAKGLEADHTWILRPDLLPSPRASTPAQLLAEKNLEYVAITRAKATLTFLPREE